MNKTGALWLNEIRTQLPWLLVFTVFNKIELTWSIPLSFQGDRPLQGIGNAAMLSGRWLDDWPITFVFFGTFFALWGYRSFSQGRNLKTETWIRTIPVVDRVPSIIKLGTGIVMVAMVFLLDLVITIGILNATGQSGHLHPNYQTIILLGKGLMVLIFSTWYLAGCWIAQWGFRLQRWHPLLTMTLAIFILSFSVWAMIALPRMDVGSNLGYISRNQMIVLSAHIVPAFLFAAMVMRGQRKWQIA